ncbi:hypothetical protein Tco_0568529 [Tanacetum coccineum]
MVTPVEKRSSNKFCDFHNDKGHSTDECKDQLKVGKKEVPAKDRSMAIYMIQPWHRTTRQKVTQSFKRVSEITFPSLPTSNGTEGPLVIEAEIARHMIHRMYVDGVDADHSTKSWMDFIIVRSLSPYNGIIGRPGIREIRAVPSTTHRMLKFPVGGGIVTIRNTILIPAECATVIISPKEVPKEAEKTCNNDKSLNEIQLENEKEDEFVVMVVKVVHECRDGRVVEKEIVSRLLEEEEVSYFGKEVMILEWMVCDSILA